MMKTLLAAAAIAAFSAPAFAQTPTTPQGETKTAAEQAFAKHDTDQNGSLSLTEVQAIDSTITQADFDIYDTDKSGGISPAEFAKWVEAKSTPPASTPG